MTAVQEYMEHDHARLDALLRESIASEFSPSIYNGFRSGLLRHIAIEEKLLFPLLKSREEIKPILNTLRQHHGALAALLIPKGSDDIARALQHILQVHNGLEEGQHGVYATLGLTAEEMQALSEKAESYPAVPLSGAIDKLTDLAPVRRAMERAGFDATQYF